MVFDCSSTVTARQFSRGLTGVCLGGDHSSIYVVTWTAEESLQKSVLAVQTRYKIVTHNFRLLNGSAMSESIPMNVDDLVEGVFDPV